MGSIGVIAGAAFFLLICSCDTRTHIPNEMKAPAPRPEALS